MNVQRQAMGSRSRLGGYQRVVLRQKEYSLVGGGAPCRPAQARREWRHGRARPGAIRSRSHPVAQTRSAPWLPPAGSSGFGGTPPSSLVRPEQLP